MLEEQTAEPLIPETSPLKVNMDQILAELIQA
jgi:hypothetical protein